MFAKSGISKVVLSGAGCGVLFWAGSSLFWWFLQCWCWCRMDDLLVIWRWILPRFLIILGNTIDVKARHTNRSTIMKKWILGVIILLVLAQVSFEFLISGAKS